MTPHEELKKEIEKITGLTWWHKLKFKLFGEWKRLYWFIAVLVLGQILLAGTIAYMILHFVFKHW